MSEQTKTKERPILFRGEMVRAILDGRKTQTRRVVKPQPIGIDDFPMRHPFGKPGDLLWVRETWGMMPTQFDFEKWIVYRSDGMAHRCGVASDEGVGYMPSNPALLDDWIPRVWSGPTPKPWRPSIYMPRWASRITLETTSVRVERLNDISEEDAKAEGMEFHDGGEIHHSGWRWDRSHGVVYDACALAFRRLFESINGPEAWTANPWVWVIEFNRVESPALPSFPH